MLSFWSVSSGPIHPLFPLSVGSKNSVTSPFFLLSLPKQGRNRPCEQSLSDALTCGSRYPWYSSDTSPPWGDTIVGTAERPRSPGLQPRKTRLVCWFSFVA